MCGFAGLLLHDAITPERGQLDNMTDSIQHRGPDDADCWVGPHIGLGFRRLSIVDLEHGQQPIANEDGTLRMVFNGEIYNCKELRTSLEQRGHRFRSLSDSEVIVHLYEEMGEQCVHQLRGMFAFFIWDGSSKTLFGARDHFGIKPVYYCAGPNSFVFASEIKAILASGIVDRRVKPESFLNYLTFQYVPEPLTMFQHIYKLPPAHYIKASVDGRIELHQYWDAMLAPQDMPLQEAAAQVRHAFEQSVAYHMISDVECGCLLSSGIDSTAIAAAMRRHGPVRTFSVGFEGPDNETLIAEQTARQLGTIHESRIITRDEYFKTIPQAVWHLDEPLADPSAIALCHVASLASQQVKVVLSGEGADELFGGYRIYREPLALAMFGMFPGAINRLLHLLARQLPARTIGRGYVLRGTTSLEQRFLGNAKIFTEELKAELITSFSHMLLNYEKPSDIAGKYYAKSRHLDPVSRMQYIDLNLWLPGNILMKADKMSMAHSLELRVPFLDKLLFEVASKIPAALRTAKRTTKYVMRKAMEGLVPEHVLHRPKLGFPVPLRRWLKEIDPRLLLEPIEASGLGHYIRMDKMEAMLSRHQLGQGDYARQLWTLYIFAVWHAIYEVQVWQPGRQIISG